MVTTLLRITYRKNKILGDYVTTDRLVHRHRTLQKLVLKERIVDRYLQNKDDEFKEMLANNEYTKIHALSIIEKILGIERFETYQILFGKGLKKNEVNKFRTQTLPYLQHVFPRINGILKTGTNYLDIHRLYCKLLKHLLGYQKDDPYPLITVVSGAKMIRKKRYKFKTIKFNYQNIATDLEIMLRSNQQHIKCYRKNVLLKVAGFPLQFNEHLEGTTADHQKLGDLIAKIIHDIERLAERDELDGHNNK